MKTSSSHQVQPKTQASKKSAIQIYQDSGIRWFQKPYPLRNKRSKQELSEGRKSRGVFYEESVYYYWFEFLKLSKKYKAACDADGKGMKRLYKNFGNVFEVDFMDWWETKNSKGHDRGALLFGDEIITKMDRFISIDEAIDMREAFDSDSCKLLAVPLTATKKEISRLFTLLLRDLEVSTTARVSTANFRIQNLRTTAKLLNTSLEAFKYKTEYGYTNTVIGAILSKRDDTEEHRQKDQRIIDELLQRMGKRAKRGSGFEQVEKYGYYNLVATRALNRIEPNVLAAEEGFFPVRDMSEFKSIKAQRKARKHSGDI